MRTPHYMRRASALERMIMAVFFSTLFIVFTCAFRMAGKVGLRDYRQALVETNIAAIRG